MKGSEFVFDYVQLLYYKCHKKIPMVVDHIYIDSLGWIKNKKATKYLTNNKNNKRFQYAITVILNHEEIGKNHKRITKIKTFINKYKWKGINFPSEKYDWKKLGENNVTIALNVLNVLHAKNEKIYSAYVSKHNSNHEKQVILLIISNGEKQWHYLAVKNYQHY